jgi:rare lipoprotein A
MKYIASGLACVCAIVLASCGGAGGKMATAIEGLPPAETPTGVSDFPVKIGEPFTVGGKSYKPEDTPGYDEVGYASWYGDELAGRPTANGEVFFADGVSAAHKTLPLPSYVEVTALDTGQTIVVRVNDRGPFSNDRLLDLSAGAARQLGIMGQGVTAVRVRRVNPPEQERAVLRAGRAAPARTATPESLLKILREKVAKLPRPSGVVRQAATVPSVQSPNSNKVPATVATAGAPYPSNGRFVREGAGSQAQGAVAQPAPISRPAPRSAPVTANGRFVREGGGSTPVVVAPAAATGSFYVVQIAAYASRSRAEDLARRSGAMVAPSADGQLYRVRFGPYRTQAEADQALAAARSRGHSGARIFVD